MPLPTDLPTIATAVGALGAASFALVDATKIGRDGGISNHGFVWIAGAVRKFLPHETRTPAGREPPPGGAMLDTLHSHWIDGMPLADQKAIAKSLLKLALTENNADKYAAAARVDAAELKSAAGRIVRGEAMTPADLNVYGRVDAAITAQLDEGYHRADQRYRNNTRVCAALVAVILAVLGGWSLEPVPAYWLSPEMWKAVLVGFLAVPMAPISKDLASALSAGVKAAQAVKR